MKYYNDGIAAERIMNGSVCIKEGHMIRNLKANDDVNMSELVVVDNEAGTYIEPMFCVRYRTENMMM